MLEKITQIFRVKELRIKILFVLAVFAITRIIANIPVLGIEKGSLRNFFAENQAFGLFNLFTGGSMDRLSVVMLGLGPYITATIILQLLTMIFPRLNEMYKEEGETGREKFNQYSRLATIPLSMLQGYAMLALLQRQNILQPMSLQLTVISLVTITAGTMLLMFLGELITEKGIGNGISLLIFAGIVTDIPTNIKYLISTFDKSMIPSYLLFLAMVLIVTAGVVLVTEGKRNIPVSYAKRVRGNKMYGGASTYLPLNVNPAGVIPIIFSLSIMLFPRMIANFFAGGKGVFAHLMGGIASFLEQPIVYGVMYFILIVLFTFFYTAVTFDPKTTSENLQKMGGFIPGIRPGKPTASFISYILNRVQFVGALFLGVIAIMPNIIGSLTGITVFRFLVGGTALLIVVSVILETMRQIKSQLQMREYESF